MYAPKAKFDYNDQIRVFVIFVLLVVCVSVCLSILIIIIDKNVAFGLHWLTMTMLRSLSFFLFSQMRNWNLPNRCAWWFKRLTWVNKQVCILTPQPLTQTTKNSNVCLRLQFVNMKHLVRTNINDTIVLSYSNLPINSHTARREPCVTHGTKAYYKMIVIITKRFECVSSNLIVCN